MLLIGMCKEEIGPNYKTFIHEHSIKYGKILSKLFKSNYMLGLY